MKNFLSRPYTLLFLFVVFGLTTIYGQSTAEIKSIAGISEDRLERYDQFLMQEIEEGRIAGAVSLITRRGVTAHEKAFGSSSLKDKTPMRQDNIFQMMSMTKPIVTAAFMMLYEEGYFFLNDPVEKYLPEFKDLKVAKDVSNGKDGPTEPAGKKVTIAQVLSHTAGFSHGLQGTKLDNDIAKALYYEPQENLESRVKTLAKLPLIGQPGEQWYYSASPDILGRLIEHFSGQSAADFLQERIFDPLGMQDTGYNVPKKSQSRWVPVHNLDENGKLVHSDPQFPSSGHTVYGGTHGLFSTASDYLKFCQMMINKGQFNGKHLLSPKTVELMTMNQIGDLNMGPGRGFGFGFGVLTNLADTKTLGSEGTYHWGGAYSTYFFIDPKEELIAILLTQLQPFSNFYEAKLRQFVYQSIID